MKQNFNDCLNRLLKDEGGYTNDPVDPGGPTNFGITIYDYRKYISPKGTALDVRRMSVDQAKTIYRSKYWDALSCDDLPSGVDYTVFDYGVNSGLGRPRKCLKRFSGLTGIQLINAINDERMAFLRSLHTYSRFGKGWARRVAGVRSHSIELANRKSNTVPISVGTGVVGIGAYLTQFWHQHEQGILIAGAILIVGGISYLIYKVKHG